MNEDADMTDDRTPLDESLSDFEREEIHGDQIVDFRFAGKSFSDCDFIGCDLSDRDLTGTEFERCRFTRCNVSNPVVDRTTLDSATFTESKLLGIHFHHFNPFTFSVAFERSILRNCSFDRLKLQGVVCRECDIIESGFIECELEGAIFDGTRFRDTAIEGNDLRNASFRNAVDYAIDPTTNRVAGALFSVPDVLRLLSVFQIRVEGVNE